MTARSRPAEAALANLRKEAPGEVCQRCDAALGSSTDEVKRQRSHLQRLRSAPRMKCGELKAAHHALRPWLARMAMTVRSFEEVAGELETFRAKREEAQGMLASLPPKLTRMDAEREPGSSEGVLPAAAVETYNRALQESQKDPANWLLVYDLPADVSECLAQIENPSMPTPYRPARYWFGDI